jgi:trans-aconitate 2-methyltransferase
MNRATTPDWDAKTYDRLASPQEEWARVLLDERLPLKGDETVLDAGCGSGRVTRLLLERLPEGLVLGVDGSPSMIENARESLTAFSDRLVLINSDLLELSPAMVEQAIGRPTVDAVFSNATFHWIDDDERLYARLFEVLPPGGRLEAQCGGKGNVPEWVEAVQRATARPEFEQTLRGFWPWHFRGTDETERRLRAEGFTDVRCWLWEGDYEPADPRNWVSVVGLAPHRERLPEELRDPFTEAVLEELPDPLVHHYVRLNISARRPE